MGLCHIFCGVLGGDWCLITQRAGNWPNPRTTNPQTSTKATAHTMDKSTKLNDTKCDVESGMSTPVADSPYDGQPCVGIETDPDVLPGPSGDAGDSCVGIEYAPTNPFTDLGDGYEVHCQCILDSDKRWCSVCLLEWYAANEKRAVYYSYDMSSFDGCCPSSNFLLSKLDALKDAYAAASGSYDKHEPIELFEVNHVNCQTKYSESLLGMFDNWHMYFQLWPGDCPCVNATLYFTTIDALRVAYDGGLYEHYDKVVYVNGAEYGSWAVAMMFSSQLVPVPNHGTGYMFTSADLQVNTALWDGYDDSVESDFSGDVASELHTVHDHFFSFEHDMNVYSIDGGNEVITYVEDEFASELSTADLPYYFFYTSDGRVQTRLLPGFGDWLRDLTTEGVEPNPGPGVFAGDFALMPIVQRWSLIGVTVVASPIFEEWFKRRYPRAGVVMCVWEFYAYMQQGATFGQRFPTLCMHWAAYRCSYKWGVVLHMYWNYLCIAPLVLYSLSELLCFVQDLTEQGIEPNPGPYSKRDPVVDLARGMLRTCTEIVPVLDVGRCPLYQEYPECTQMYIVTPVVFNGVIYDYYNLSMCEKSDGCDGKRVPRSKGFVPDFKHEVVGFRPFELPLVKLVDVRSDLDSSPLVAPIHRMAQICYDIVNEATDPICVMDIDLQERLALVLDDASVCDDNSRSVPVSACGENDIYRASCTIGSFVKRRFVPPTFAALRKTEFRNRSIVQIQRFIRKTLAAKRRLRIVREARISMLPAFCRAVYRAVDWLFSPRVRRLTGVATTIHTILERNTFSRDGVIYPPEYPLRTGDVRTHEFHVIDYVIACGFPSSGFPFSKHVPAVARFRADATFRNWINSELVSVTSPFWRVRLCKWVVTLATKHENDDLLLAADFKAANVKHVQYFRRAFLDLGDLYGEVFQQHFSDKFNHAEEYTKMEMYRHLRNCLDSYDASQYHALVSSEDFTHEERPLLVYDGTVITNAKVIFGHRTVKIKNEIMKILLDKCLECSFLPDKPKDTLNLTLGFVRWRPFVHTIVSLSCLGLTTLVLLLRISAQGDFLSSLNLTKNFSHGSNCVKVLVTQANAHVRIYSWLVRMSNCWANFSTTMRTTKSFYWGLTSSPLVPAITDFS